jgi:hypothetical protein
MSKGIARSRQARLHRLHLKSHSDEPRFHRDDEASVLGVG